MSDEKERYDKSWRSGAIGGLDAAIYQINRAILYLKDENDYFAQVHGHSALKEVAEALANMAAAIERKPK